MIPQGNRVRIKTISGIESFIPSDDHIIKHSSLHVRSLSDLKDSRLGVSDRNPICGTCGLTYQFCAGHHGHLTLAMPIFRVLYLNRLQQILSNVCFFCQRFKYKDNPDIMTALAKLPNNQRLDFLCNVSKSSKFNHCGHIHYCSDVSTSSSSSSSSSSSFSSSSCVKKTAEKRNSKKCSVSNIKRPSSTLKSIEKFGCGHRFVDWELKNKEALTLHAIISLEESDWKFTDAELEVRITPKMVHTVLSMISIETCGYMGLDKDNHPKSMMWTVIPIPSFNTRPNHQYYNKTMMKNAYENDWTRYLRMIIQCNNRLSNTLNEGGMPDDVSLTIYKYNKKQHHILPLLRPNAVLSTIQLKTLTDAFSSDTQQKWERLNGTVASFHSYKTQKILP